MGDQKGFLKIKRQNAGYRPISERVKDFQEVENTLPLDKRQEQASRCMDCGVPFCHWACPISNVMPDWQELVFRGDFENAAHLLHKTNNFPEFTGRVCPALCEGACVLAIGDEAVAIRENELSVIEYAFAKGYIKPRLPKIKIDKKIAIIGSGPAGLACADDLNQMGYDITVFEREKRLGGLLRYGIPDFKLNKDIIERRIKILETEGIKFKTSIEIGVDFKKDDLFNDFDAICLAIGAKEARDLNIKGRELKGIYLAMDYLSQQNKIIAKEPFELDLIDANNKNVLVIGGGDTGSDCVGTANRQGAKSVTQIEIMPKPSLTRDETCPWPQFPKILKTSSSHLEGCERMWNIATKEFIGKDGKLEKVLVNKVEWLKDEKDQMKMKEIDNSDFFIDADLVFLAMGFTNPEHKNLLDSLNLTYDARGNILAQNYQTNSENIFVAGDARRGASLVVWAISEGKECALAIKDYLKE